MTYRELTRKLRRLGCSFPAMVRKPRNSHHLSPGTATFVALTKRVRPRSDPTHAERASRYNVPHRRYERGGVYRHTHRERISHAQQR